MKIDGTSQDVNSELKVQKGDEHIDQQTKVEQIEKISDRLEFSVYSGEFQRLRQNVHEAPEIRAERVAELKQQIEAGTYNIKAEKVAEAMITGGLIDEKA